MRCQLALFSAYRIDQYADPEGFKVSLGAILEGFSDDVIRYVCDPRTGLQRRMKWPPTISEVVEACEEHQAYLQKVRAQRPVGRQLSKPYEKPKTHLGNVFVACDHPGYTRLVESWRLQPYRSPEGREGVLAPADLLIDMGLMKKGAA